MSLVGGCCGTPAHIAAVAKRVRSEPVKSFYGRPRPEPKVEARRRRCMSRSADSGTRPLIVGERSNANGSKKFRELLLREDFEGLVEVGREQVAEGAHLIDVCTAYVGRDEVRDMRECSVATPPKLPSRLVIDTTQLDVLEAALQMLGGRAVINSVNLETAKKKPTKVCAGTKVWCRAGCADD